MELTARAYIAPLHYSMGTIMLILPPLDLPTAAGMIKLKPAIALLSFHILQSCELSLSVYQLEVPAGIISLNNFDDVQ